MAFALSGSTITQTGTDTSLAGLAGIAGVTTSDRGDLTEYIIDALQLDIQGNLSFNAHNERLRWINSNLITVPQIKLETTGATFEVLITKTVNGVTSKNPDQLAIDFGPANFGFTLNASGAMSLYVVSDCVATLRGVFILGDAASASGARLLVNSASAVINLDDCRIIDERTDGNSQVRANNGTVNITNSVLFYGISLTNGGSGVSNVDPSSSFKIKDNNEAIVLNSQIEYHRFTNFADDNAGTSVRHNNSGASIYSEFLDPERGNNLTFVTNNAEVSHTSIITQSLRLRPQDSSFTNISAKYWFTDTDSGNRASANITTPAPDNTTYNVTGDLVYSGTANNTLVKYLSGHWHAELSVTEVFDNRGSPTIYYYAYGYMQSTAQPDIFGAGEKLSVAILAEDDQITEASSATALAYTSTTTAATIYDHLAAIRDRDYAGPSTPRVVTKTGNDLDFGSLNVTLDNGTGEAVVGASSVTLYMGGGALTANITTTGTVTIGTGVTVSSTIIDSVADSALSFSGVDSWIVYASAANRDSNTSALGSGTGADNFRFNFSGGTVYYLRLTAGTDTIFRNVTPSASGITLVELTTASLLAGVSNKLGFVPRIVFLDTSASINGDGSNASPFNSVADAVSFAKAQGIPEIRFTGNVTLASDSSGLSFVAQQDGHFFNFNGQVFDRSLVQNCIVTGAMTINTTACRIKECVVANVTGMWGVVQDSLFNGNMTTANDTSIVRCVNGSDVTPTITVTAPYELGMRDIQGTFILAGVQTGSEVHIDMTAGEIEIASSCTGGTIHLSGTFALTDNSAGSTVTDVRTVKLIRTEFGTEMGRLDATVSSRLASASYTAPDNATISSIDSRLPASPATEATTQAALDAAKAAPFI